MIARLAVPHVRNIAYAYAVEELAKLEPIPPFETCNIALLDSALKAPFQTFGGQLLHRGLTKQAAVLLYGLIKNHPFPNGNKRIGFMSAIIFLWLNGRATRLTDDSWIMLCKLVAESKPAVRDNIIEVIKAVLDITLFRRKDIRRHS